MKREWQYLSIQTVCILWNYTIQETEAPPAVQIFQVQSSQYYAGFRGKCSADFGTLLEMQHCLFFRAVDLYPSVSALVVFFIDVSL